MSEVYKVITPKEFLAKKKDEREPTQEEINHVLEYIQGCLDNGRAQVPFFGRRSMLLGATEELRSNMIVALKRVLLDQKWVMEVDKSPYGLMFILTPTDDA